MKNIIFLLLLISGIGFAQESGVIVNCHGVIYRVRTFQNDSPARKEKRSDKLQIGCPVHYRIVPFATDTDSFSPKYYKFLESQLEAYSEYFHDQREDSINIAARELANCLFVDPYHREYYQQEYLRVLDLRPTIEGFQKFIRFTKENK